jgi:threonyl-tRNA synthetase
VMLPERFRLEYIAEDGSRKRPVAIHRAIFGSFERFVGIITEHFAGAFPTWLAPVQAAVMPITDAQREYAGQVAGTLRDAGVRVELDDRNEKIGYKIRDWEMKKVPYMLITGEKEKAGGSVSVRAHKKGDLGVIALENFTNSITREISQKLLTTEEKRH